MDAASTGGIVGLRQMVSTSTGRVFSLICVLYFITYIDRVNISTLAPLIAHDLHFSNIQLGLAFSAFGYTYALFQILGGMTADRIGARWTLTICGLVWASGTVLTVAICLSGAFFFLELTVGPIWAIPMDVAPLQSGTAAGIMNTGSAIAGIVSPLAFGIVSQLTGSYSLPFLGSIALLLVGAVLAATGLPTYRTEAAAAATDGASLRAGA